MQGRSVLNGRVILISGFGGTGKTTSANLLCGKLDDPGPGASIASKEVVSQLVLPASLLTEIFVGGCFHARCYIGIVCAVTLSHTFRQIAG